MDPGDKIAGVIDRHQYHNESAMCVQSEEASARGIWRFSHLIYNVTILRAHAKGGSLPVGTYTDFAITDYIRNI
jgi:hypothetical protein